MNSGKLSFRGKFNINFVRLNRGVVTERVRPAPLPLPFYSKKDS
jgi:hypothetical protein